MNSETNNENVGQEIPPAVPVVETVKMDVIPAKRRRRGFWKGLLLVMLLCALGGGSVATRDMWMAWWTPVGLTGPYMITAAEYRADKVSKDGVEFTALFDIEVFKNEGWKRIPLLPSTVAIRQADVPAGAYLHLADGMYSILTARGGKMKVSLTYSVAATEMEGLRTVTFSRVPSITCLLKATLPSEQLDVTVAGSQSIETVRTNGQTSVTAALPDHVPVTLTWKGSLPALPECQPTLHCETKTLISLAEGLLIGQARVDFSVLHAAARELKLKVPAGVNVREVTGRDIRDWRVTGEQLSVQLEKEVIGPFRIDIKYEVASTSQSGRWVVPVITGDGVARESGEIGVVSLTNLEIKNGEVRNAHLIDVKDLPAEILAMTAQPVLLAYRYTVPSFSVSLDVSRHDEVAVLLTMIDRALFTVMQTRDGKRITRGVYNVRNNRNQFLRLKLPKDAELWSASVAGRSTPLAKDEQGRVLLPLIRSQGGGMSAFPVEIVYAEPGVEPDERGRGTPHVELPVSSEPVMHMMVTLFLPKEGSYDDFSGSLRKVDHFTAMGGLPQPVVQNVAESVQAMQQAVVLNRPPESKGGDMEVQLPLGGTVYLLEKILVVQDLPWFSYAYAKLKR